MSQKNSDGKRQARERMAEERAKQQAAQKRKRALIVGGSVVAVLAIAAGIGIAVGNSSSSNSSGKSATALTYPKGVVGDGTIIVDGKLDAPAVLTVYEDFRCPYCDQVEKTNGDTMRQMVAAGSIRIEYQIASFLDKNLGGNGSKRAANAAACAQDAGLFEPYHKVLYLNQPDETDDKFSNDKYLIQLAGQVPGLVTPQFTSCVENGTFIPWVKKSQEGFDNAKVEGQPVTGTPTMAVNGKKISVLDSQGNSVTPDQFKQNVDAAIGATQPPAPAVLFTPPAPSASPSK